MNVPLTLELRKSSKTGKLYPAFCADLGYRKVNLVVDRTLLAELFDISPHKLFTLFGSSLPDNSKVEDGVLVFEVGSYETSGL